EKEREGSGRWSTENGNAKEKRDDADACFSIASRGDVWLEMREMKGESWFVLMELMLQSSWKMEGETMSKTVVCEDDNWSLTGVDGRRPKRGGREETRVRRLG
ncbi:hypothetical protein HAX54_051597, partial [Datura stramonium]|nr:hypothetical protein [Datura stramonium]